MASMFMILIVTLITSFILKRHYKYDCRQDTLSLHTKSYSMFVLFKRLLGVNWRPFVLSYNFTFIWFTVHNGPRQSEIKKETSTTMSTCTLF